MNVDLLRAELTRDEGLRLKPYLDSVGKWTIGIGRNLDDVGISRDEAETLLAHDIASAMDQLDRALPWWRDLDEVRQRVLVNMTFNMGIAKLLTFRNTLRLVKAGEYGAASAAMMESLWARQVGPRARRLSEMMRTGKDLP